jgi:hypothetical protein
MCRILRALVIAFACTALLAGTIFADDGDTVPPPDTNGDPVDPQDATLSTPDQMVLADVSRAMIVLGWMVPWVIR